ncbi:Ankyrin repeats (many copies) [Phytophthora infestans]|uniref:Ankyrin repeats (Many copies) n=1 Tax=Phytophthora infestans TaxID=4787 RepID=A0A8S9V274_PHYIN|nr:Ankyrin repeats (many copies) [Phytophthora infestans]
MAAATNADAVATSAASFACATSIPAASCSTDPGVSSEVLTTMRIALDKSADSDEEEVTTAEFAVDLADGQTWAINFYECAAEGDLECLEEILDSGRVGVNDVDVDGFTALMVAAAEGHRDVVRALLRRGADVGVRTHELRSTALHFAAKNGDAEIVAALCECDTAVVDSWNVNADTPLIWACIEGRAEAVKVLLKHGADVNMLNQYGASTLLCAVMIGEDPEQDEESDKGRAEIVAMLLEKNGKLVNFQDREGSTAMHLATSCGYLECVKTLMAYGADITLRNAIGQTPLEEAQDSELRESGPCVEHLRGIWRQLEEEAAARMMAMLEMEEEADKNATGASGTGTTSSSKKSKKKNKKAKRKAAKQQQQQEAELDVNLIRSKSTKQEESLSTEREPVIEEPSAEPDREATVESTNVVKEEEESASSDEERELLVRDSMVSAGQDSEDEVEDTAPDAKSTQGIDATASAGAWTTVGKKHRSPVGAITNGSVKASGTSQKDTTLSTPTRRKSTTSSPKSIPHTSRPKLNQRSSNYLNSTGRINATSTTTASSSNVARTWTRPQEERWKRSSNFSTPRSIASSSLLNPNALAFRSVGLATGSSNTSRESSVSTTSSGLSFSSTSPWRPSFDSPPVMAPNTVAASSLSSSGVHYGRLTWKQQRTNGNHQVAREARERWVSKLRLGNENVAETLGYLACGLCGELVNDNLQCSAGASGEKASACTQLYCASCLESSAFRTADSTVFKCVRCHEVVAKESMSRNSLAQAQAASLGLSMSSSTNAGAHDNHSLEDMQHFLEVSEPRASAVDLRVFYLVPGADLSTLSNGQLDVLESAHQRALAQIMEQRVADARILERLRMEEWLKMQRDVLQFAPR